MQLKITLPLPPPQLSPNWTVGSRGGRLGKAAKAKKYRGDCTLAALAAVNDTYEWLFLPWQKATVQITYFFRDRRRRDKDGLLSWLKQAFDALQVGRHGQKGAGIIADDSGLTFLPVEVAVDKDHPRVELIVEKQE